MLPRPLPPYPNEMVKSFIARLEIGNGLGLGDLGLDKKASSAELPVMLSELTGRPIKQLLLALPDLHRRSYPRQTIVKVPRRDEIAGTRLACQRCTLARGAGDQVIVWATHEDVVCHRHQRWLGPTWDTSGQFDVRGCLEILQAQRRHRNLISRHGRHRVAASYEFALSRCHRWFASGYHYTTALNRLNELQRPGNHRSAEVGPQLWAGLYPNVVALTAILASPRWRALSRSADSAERFRFYQRIITEVTEGQDPSLTRDRLRNWIPDALDTRPVDGAGTARSATADQLLTNATAGVLATRSSGPEPSRRLSPNGDVTLAVRGERAAAPIGESVF
jgi:hypothetical protein